jgi:ubiquinone/menaquinone biosynthesis C-methylase UbiE
MGEDEIESGVVWCRACRNWFPIEGGLLELLPPKLAYVADRKSFWQAHQRDLRALDLEVEVPETGYCSVEPQRKQQEHFDWYASNETQAYRTYHRMPFWQAEDSRVFSAWRMEVQPGQWLLEVGCAEGRAAFNFMDLPLNIVGFDISKALVRQAIAQYRAGNYRAEATFFVADGSNLPFTPESFDRVLIYGVLHHLPDPAQTCRQLAEVLKPGGTYLGSENNQTVFRWIFRLVMKLNPLWHEEAGAEPLISAKQLRRWFKDTPMRVETKTHVFLLPHLVNVLGTRWGARLLHWSDWIAQHIPWLRNHGGLIVIRGYHTGQAAI